jgi:hypothetical protein
MQVLLKALEKNAAHILYEIEDVNNNVVELLQQIKSLMTMIELENLDEEYEVNKENFLLSRRFFEILRDLFATSPGCCHINSLPTPEKDHNLTHALFESDETLTKCLVLYRDYVICVAIVNLRL